MKTLALEASTQALSVAVYNSLSPQDSTEHFEVAPRAHSVSLLPTAQKLLDDMGWTLTDLDGLAFGRGPGAFTGLRIAAGFIQGLAYGSDLPVAPISTLQALALRALNRHAGDNVRVVQDARMGEIYTADFKRVGGYPELLGDERVIKPQALEKPSDANEWLYAGNGWPVVAEVRDQDMPEICEQWPHALDVSCLGAETLEQGGGVAARQALPVYVRDDVARKPG